MDDLSDRVVADDPGDPFAIGDVAPLDGDPAGHVGAHDHPQAPRVVAQVEDNGRSPSARRPRTTHAPIQPKAPVTRTLMDRNHNTEHGRHLLRTRPW